MLSNGDGCETFLAGGDINVASHEVHKVGAFEEKLGHPGVVVVLRGNVAIAALFGFLGAHRVGNEGGEGLAGEARGRNGLLGVVEPIAIGVLRTDEHGARRARGRNAMAGDGAVDAEHVNVVAKNLEIVAGVVLREQTFVVQHGLAGVGGHLQMAAETGGCPGSVAGIAGHAAVGMRERSVAARQLRRHHAILVHELCAKGFLAEMHVAGGNGVDRLNDLPLLVFFGHRALK